MEAVEYLKAKSRMCNVLVCNCLMSKRNNGKELLCGSFEKDYPEQAVEIVEKWANEHPIKTYLSVLLEKFPMVPLDEKGLPKTFCPEEIYGGEEWECCHNKVEGKCKKCWNREYKEED